MKKLLLIALLIVGCSTEPEDVTAEFFCDDSEIEVYLWGKCYDTLTTTKLDLSNNQLTGEIPQEVCDLIESNNLDIENHILQGNNLINTCD